MELGGRDDFSKLLHVSRFDVHDVCTGGDIERKERKRRDEKQRTEALVTDVQIPEVDTQIVCGNVCLLIGINGDRMDMISMCVGVNFARYGGDDVVLVLHTG